MKRISTTPVKGIVGRISPLTARQKVQVALLKASPDSQIDYSEIPRLTSASLRKARPNPYIAKRSDAVIELAPDVYEWMRSLGKSKLNSSLREAMRASH